MTAQDPTPTGPALATDADAAPRSTAGEPAPRPPRRLRPGRRTLAWAILATVLAGAILAVLRPSDALSGIASVAVALLGAGTLARYVPTVGTRLDVGCTPCAVASGLSVPIAIGVLAGGMAPLAVAIAAFGLVQRLRQPDTCPT